MLAKLQDFDGNIELIENSGIQFVDFELDINWDKPDPANAAKAELQQKYSTCYFLRAGSNDPLIWMAPADGKGNEMYINTHSGQSMPKERMLDLPNLVTIEAKDALQLYREIWFPVPFLNHNTSDIGPTNWARCRIVRVANPHVAPGTKPEKGRMYYRAVFAFDTHTESNPAGAYFCPSPADVESGNNFELSLDYQDLAALLRQDDSGRSYMQSWCKQIFMDLASEEQRLPDFRDCSQDELQEAVSKQRLHEAYYLTVLSVIKHLLKPRLQQVRLIGFARNRQNKKPIDVSLVLDIGNSRSCGLLFEKNSDNDDRNLLNNAFRLELRDLNKAEQIYDRPFVSRVEFAEADFDYNGLSDTSGHINAFRWPSLVRVGQEAQQLSALRHGNEGATGLTSPKRYLWDTKLAPNDRGWNFNPYTYQTKSPTIRTRKSRIIREADSYPVSAYINSAGEALFALKDSGSNNLNMKRLYSNKSMMTFMLLEIFVQAIVQINSISHRLLTSDKEAPRRLGSVILTYPPAMPMQEREIFRSCAYEALGILWKSMGYDPSDRYDFAFRHNADIYPAVPQVFLNWNEAEGAQIVYLYNECNQIFGGNGKQFLHYQRRSDAEGRIMDFSTEMVKVYGEDVTRANACARLASIDIGGGTCDLSIRDYCFPEDKSEGAAKIEPHELLREGFKIAGDDILKELIERTVIATLRQNLRLAGADDSILSKVIGISGDNNATRRMLRQQLTQQLFMKVALRILFHLEHSFNPRNIPADGQITVTGSVADFLTGTEINECIDHDSNIEKPAPDFADRDKVKYLLKDVVKYIDDTLRQTVPAFPSILDLHLVVDLEALNQDFASGRGWNICRPLSRLCELVSLYKCDVLLLTGRPTKIPGIHTFFTQRLNMSPARIIAMHNYQCSGHWYPFSTDGQYIGDPKTTAAVGAMLSFIRMEYQLPVNFRYHADAEDSATTTMRYIGVLDNENKMSELLYRYQPKALQRLSAQAELDLSDEERQEREELEQKPFERCHIDPKTHEVVVNDEDKQSFEAILPLTLGYKQFLDSRFDAMPLYRIEDIKNVEDMPSVRKVLDFQTGTDVDKAIEEFSLLLDYAQDLKTAFTQELKELEQKPDFVALKTGDTSGIRSRIHQEMVLAVTAEVNARHAGDKVSGISRLFGGQKKLEAEKQAELQQAIASHEAEVDAQVGECMDKLQTEYNNSRVVLIRRYRTRLAKMLREQAADTLEKVGIMLRGTDNFSIVLKAEDAHDKDNFLVRELKLKPYYSNFVLDKVKSSRRGSGMGLEKAFRTVLRTVSDNDVSYWIDSGILL